jgi:hypothetical protein
VRNTIPCPPAPSRRVRLWYSVQLSRPALEDLAVAGEQFLGAAAADLARRKSEIVGRRALLVDRGRHRWPAVVVVVGGDASVQGGSENSAARETQAACRRDSAAGFPHEIPMEIIAEKVGHCIDSAGRLAGDVRRDHQPRGRPEPAFRCGRFVGSDIEGGGIEVAALEGVDEGVSTTSGPRAMLTRIAPRLHPRDRGGVDHAAGLRAVSGAQRKSMSASRAGGERLRARRETPRRRLADRKVVGGEDPHAERCEHLHEPAAVAPQAHDADGGVGEVAGGPADELPPGCCSRKSGIRRVQAMARPSRARRPDRRARPRRS